MDKGYVHALFYYEDTVNVYSTYVGIYTFQYKRGRGLRLDSTNGHICSDGQSKWKEVHRTQGRIFKILNFSLYL
jgi:hypothetical protein